MRKKTNKNCRVKYKYIEMCAWPVFEISYRKCKIREIPHNSSRVTQWKCAIKITQEDQNLALLDSIFWYLFLYVLCGFMRLRQKTLYRDGFTAERMQAVMLVHLFPLFMKQSKEHVMTLLWKVPLNIYIHTLYLRTFAPKIPHVRFLWTSTYIHFI